MGTVNEATIIGRLGRDPESIPTATGTAMATFSVATNSHKKKGEVSIQETHWHDVKCFGKVAEMALEHLRKGREVYVRGEIQYRTYTDKEGIKRKATSISAANVQFLGAGEGDSRGRVSTESAPDDEMPF